MGKMRQLLSRKSHQKMSDDENRSSRPNGSSSHSDLAGERVFPIRNQRENGEILTLFPSVKSDGLKTNGDRIQQPNLPNLSDLPSLPNFRSSPQPPSSPSVASHSDEHRKVSKRSQYIAPSKTAPPRVVTGAVGDNSKSTYRRCEDEPIRIPGAVQSFGALIGLKCSDDGSLEVRVASENSRKILGYGPEQLFALSSFLDVLKPEVREEMVLRVDHILEDVDATKEETRLDVFQMILTFPYEPDMCLWCALHLAPNSEGLVICEFEEYTEAFYLKDASVAKVLPVQPVSSTTSDATPEEFKRSTTSGSKPLPVLEVARKRGNKEFSSLDIFKAMTQAQKQLSDCTAVQTVLDVVVGIISELTGFHRVMLYRFDSQKNGSVDAELVNPQASTDIFRGLNYPASDIPPQARELYKINRTRILYDREAETARLVTRNETDFEQPLDLTHSYLRAMSPIHNKYLKNMGVRASMSVSIVIDNDLWGVIACHGYGEFGIRVSLPIRELCRSIGECAANNIQRLLMLQRIEARRLPNIKPGPNQNPTSFIATSSTDLLKLVDADFALVSIQDKIRAIGRMEPYHEALAIMSYLQSCRLSYPTGVKVLAGLLLIPLNVGEENDFLVFFRKGQLRHIKWAGNPQFKEIKPGNEYLEPRSSFQRWVETIAGTSKEWTEDQMDTASVLALLYGRFIETWRLKGSGAQAEPATAPASEKTPAPAQPSEAAFNLNQTALKVLEDSRKDSQRKGLELTLSFEEQLPAMVKGHRNGLKQLLEYFVSRAFIESPSCKVDVTLVRPTNDNTSLVGFKIQDTGPGMSEEQLDDIFAGVEEAQEEDWPFPPNESSPTFNESSKVDLKVIAQYVRSINGQITVTSELGKGTIFSIELPFDHSNALDVPKPRKFRTLFSPAASSRASSTPSSMKPSPSMLRSPNNAQKRVDFERSPNGSPRPYENTLSPYGTNGSPPSPISDIGNGCSTPVHLNVLIADGDSMSLRMLDEMLSQFGHTVDIASDGQECHDRFAANPSKFDVILMDLRMPGVDGMLSTRMIRMLEREAKYRSSSNGQDLKRIPIIATSLSLDEDNRFDYIQTSFDGWILKPVDFRRLNLILQAVQNPKLRRDTLYVPGQLKQGGWFLP